jgi:GntR family transcriptional regulator, arabinose operon transcriptional repressor
MPAKKPLYKTILDTLVREIREGRYGPGQKFPSEAALVRRFGASRITVGRAVRELQHSGLVDRRAGSGTWVQGGVKPSGATLLFGLVIPNLGDTEIFEPICQGMADAPEAEGCALLWPHSRASDGELKALQLAEQCVANHVSGVFFAPLEISPHAAEINRRVLHLLEKAGIPVILLDRRPERESPRGRPDLVGIDNRGAGFLAAEHLSSLGAKRIGFLLYEGQASTARLRAAGCSEVTGPAGQVFSVKPRVAFDLPPEAMRCDAFVCSNDRIAGQLMHFLLARGVRIPQDIRIVGIDDVNYAALLPVPLTTIHQPCHEIGETALRTMLERLKRPKSPARDVLLECELVVRESCGGKPRKSGD